jgi:hypothetical protein
MCILHTEDTSISLNIPSQNTSNYNKSYGKQFIEYCRAIYVDCERLQTEKMALEWSYVTREDSTSRRIESPINDYQFLHLLSY